MHKRLFVVGLVSVVAVGGSVAACSNSTASNTDEAPDAGTLDTSTPDIDSSASDSRALGEGPCATECASSVCATPQSNPTRGDVCDICLNKVSNNDGVCWPSVTTACKANADCMGLITCLKSCSTVGTDAGAPDASDPDASGGDANSCLEEATADDCRSCCFQSHLTGNDFLNKTIFACGCGN